MSSSPRLHTKSSLFRLMICPRMPSHFHSACHSNWTPQNKFHFQFSYCCIFKFTFFILRSVFCFYFCTLYSQVIEIPAECRLKSVCYINFLCTGLFYCSNQSVPVRMIA